MNYYVTRKAGGALASVHETHMPGYNDEVLSDTSPEIVAWFAAINNEAVHPPVISYESFQDRFTAAEFNAATDFVYESDLGTGKPKRRAMIQGLSRAMAKNSVNLLDARTIAFMDSLVTGGILTAARRDAILTL